MKKPTRVALWAAVVAACVAVALAWALLHRPSPVAPVPVTSAPPPAPPASQPLVEAASAARAPSAATAIGLPADAAPMTAADIGADMERLMGRKAVLSFLQLDDFPRRVVATVDNLGRERATSLLWPFNPTEGRFTVLQQDGATVISPDNGLRYTPLVLLVETVNMQHAVDLYARMYPLLQDAYEELGYPNGSFNDRLLQVIDLLLATPEPAAPVGLDLSEIKGPVPSQRPWVRYQFVDPVLESLPAGQKMLIRVGPVNERRLKAKLLEFRQRVAERSRVR